MAWHDLSDIATVTKGGRSFCVWSVSSSDIFKVYLIYRLIHLGSGDTQGRAEALMSVCVFVCVSVFGRSHHSHFWCHEQQYSFRPRLGSPHAPPTPQRRSLIGPDGRTHPCWNTHSCVRSLRHDHPVHKREFSEKYIFVFKLDLSKIRYLRRLHNAATYFWNKQSLVGIMLMILYSAV